MAIPITYQHFETVPIFPQVTYSLDNFSSFPSYLKVVLLGVIHDWTSHPYWLGLSHCPVQSTIGHFTLACYLPCWGTLGHVPKLLEAVPHQCRHAWKLSAPNVPLSIANGVIKLRKGVEIELRSIAICILGIGLVCSHYLNVFEFALSSEVTLRHTQIGTEGMDEMLLIQGDSMA